MVTTALFWDLLVLHATVVKQGWNGYPNNPLLLPGLEPETFWSQACCSTTVPSPLPSAKCWVLPTKYMSFSSESLLAGNTNQGRQSPVGDAVGLSITWANAWPQTSEPFIPHKGSCGMMKFCHRLIMLPIKQVGKVMAFNSSKACRAKTNIQTKKHFCCLNILIEPPPQRPQKDFFPSPHMYSN